MGEEIDLYTMPNNAPHIRKSPGKSTRKDAVTVHSRQHSFAEEKGSAPNNSSSSRTQLYTTLPLLLIALGYRLPKARTQSLWFYLFFNVHHLRRLRHTHPKRTLAVTNWRLNPRPRAEQKVKKTRKGARTKPFFN